MNKTIICDIDGTIALLCGRNAYDGFSSYKDNSNWPIVNMVKLYMANGYHVFFLSGRMNSVNKETSISVRDITKKWINEVCGISDDLNFSLHLRHHGDYRKDSIVKKELYEKYIKDQYVVEFVLDDRNSVVDMWRIDLGLTCLQVAYGDF